MFTILPLMQIKRDAITDVLKKLTKDLLYSNAVSFPFIDMNTYICYAYLNDHMLQIF